MATEDVVILDKEKLYDIFKTSNANPADCFIAEFMGGVLDYNGLLGWLYRFSGRDLDDVSYGIHMPAVRIQSICFSSSWQWLIPAISKIKHTIDRPEDEIGALYYDNIFSGLTSYFNIGLTFIEVVNFIRWHNEKHKIIDWQLD